MKKYLWGALVIVVLLGVATLVVNAQTAPRDLSGWAWSSNIGWLSFNSTNSGAGSGASYKVQLETDGDLTGYAWSSNIGWIKFGGLTGIPGDESNARVSGTGNVRNVSGWIRACSGTVNRDCNSATRTDGWDGWINLADEEYYTTGISDGTGGVTYVVEHDTESNTDKATLKGFSWGGDVVGWLKFSPTTNVDTVITDDNTVSLTFRVADVTVTGSTAGSKTLNAYSSGQVQANVSWSSSGYVSCSANTTTVSGPGTASGWSGALAGVDGTTSVTFSGITATAVKRLTLDCYDGENTDTRTINVTINPYSAPTVSCAMPARAVMCATETGKTFVYTSTELTPIPSGTPSTTLVNSCSALPASGTPYYCTYECQSGYERNGNRCVISDLEEF